MTSPKPSPHAPDVPSNWAAQVRVSAPAYRGRQIFDAFTVAAHFGGEIPACAELGSDRRSADRLPRCAPRAVPATQTGDGRRLEDARCEAVTCPTTAQRRSNESPMPGPLFPTAFQVTTEIRPSRMRQATVRPPNVQFKDARPTFQIPVVFRRSGLRGGSAFCVRTFGGGATDSRRVIGRSQRRGRAGRARRISLRVIGMAIRS